MRKNMFQEAYCGTAAEVSQILDEHPNGWDVYAASFSKGVGKMKPSIEILENESGDLVCYIEGETKDAIQNILDSLKIEQV